MRIGIVDLDTSHPQNWIPIERELGHEVAGVWDGASVRPPGYSARFAAEHGIPRVYSSLEEMAAEVDCAVIHGCDWDTHIEKARPFVEAGKAVLIDKPLAGNLRDLHQLRSWARQGARISGGSSLRFCIETQAWLAQPESERGVPHTVFCGCGVDEFNYGIHAYATLAGIMGAGVLSVRHLGQYGTQRRVQVNWRDGRVGFVIVGREEGSIRFFATVVTANGVHQYVPDSNQLYHSLLEKTLPYLAGETGEPPMAFDALIAPELWALAARRSWLNDDHEVWLEELTGNEGYSGAAFADEYRRAKYPAAQ